MDIIVAPCQFLKNLILFLQLLLNVSATQIHSQKKEEMGAGGRQEKEEREDASLPPNMALLSVNMGCYPSIRIWAEGL